MLTKTKIQDLKLQGYTKADIIRYYEAQGRKPPSRPTISKYYDMDVIPDDPGAKLAKPKTFDAEPFRSTIIRILETNSGKSFCMSSVYDVLEEKFIENGAYEKLPGNQQTLRNYVHYLEDSGQINREPEHHRIYDYVFDIPPGEQMLIDFGAETLYLIFGMCDESFSINYTADIPENIDKGWFMFFVTLLNHFYWFSGATLGGIFGSFIHFNTEGLDFVMTAMFVVIFMEQWLKEKKHTSAILGLGLSAFCLFVFGSDNFIIPSVFAVPCGKTDVEIYTISWKGFTVSCIWITCHLLFKRCKHICRKSWAAGIHCDNSSDCFALLETANASFHCRRNGMLYGTCTITFLSVY